MGECHMIKLKRVVRLSKQFCEHFIENYNTQLQALIILTLICVGYWGAYLKRAEREELIILLLSIMLAEILVLTVKDSISQNKLNKLLVITNSLNQLVPVSPERLDNFDKLISHAEHDLFISGIACNNVWLYMNRIIELLNQGCHIKLLISGEEAISANAKLFFGLDGDAKSELLKTAIGDVATKIDVTLNYLKLNSNLQRYFCQNMFEIRRSSQLFTEAYVGVDLESERPDKILKVTHYTYGCENTQSCPHFIITLPENEHWYNHYTQIIKEQWKNAEEYVLTESCDIFDVNQGILETVATKSKDILDDK